MTRPYTMRRRAASQAETRHRILDAALRLYETHGPTDTTLLAIAERAGVQRLTLYRHFEDERSLLDAVWARWALAHPFPPVDRLTSAVDPRQRTRTALQGVYAYYDGAAAFLVRWSADRERMPVLAELLAPFDAWIAELETRLAEGWAVHGRARDWMIALIAHSVRLDTWRSLVRQGGLSTADAARLMSRAMADIARDPYA